MPTPELQNYIAQAKAAGMTEQQIKDELLKTGWQQADINEAFGGTTAPIVNSPISNKMPIFKIGAISALAIFLIAASAGAFWYADKNFGWGIISPKKVTENTIPSQTPSQESSPQALPQESNSATPSPSPVSSNPINTTLLSPKEGFLAMRKEFFRIIQIKNDEMKNKEPGDFSPVYNSTEYKQLIDNYMTTERIQEFNTLPDIVKNLAVMSMYTSLLPSSIEEKNMNIQENINGNNASLEYIFSGSSGKLECASKMSFENNKWKWQESNCVKK